MIKNYGKFLNCELLVLLSMYVIGSHSVQLSLCVVATPQFMPGLALVALVATVVA